MNNYILHGNFGNDTFAMLLAFPKLDTVSAKFVSIETGWENPAWTERVNHGEALAKSLGFDVYRIPATMGFSDLVKERGAFPTPQFQWCANFLKGLPLLNWLDENDPLARATIVLPKRQQVYPGLQEHIISSEHFGGRAIWHSVCQLTTTARNQLLTEHHVKILTHRSLECDLCVNSDLADWQRIAKNKAVRDKIAKLEGQVKQPMFTQHHFANIDELLTYAISQPAIAYDEEQMEMGCGSPYACGE